MSFDVNKAVWWTRGSCEASSKFWEFIHWFILSEKYSINMGQNLTIM
jgi:hypothetical protein